MRWQEAGSNTCHASDYWVNLIISTRIYKQRAEQNEETCERSRQGSKKELNRNRAQNSTTNGDYANVPTVK